MRIIDIINTCSDINSDTKFTVSTITEEEISYPQFTAKTCPYEVLNMKVLCFSFLNEEESKIFNGSAVLFSVVRKEC